MKLSVDIEVLNTLLATLEGKVGETPEILDLKDKVKQANAKWVVVRIDETKWWPEATEPVYGVYLVDLNEVTYLCELTPSHYLYHLYNDGADDETGDDQNLYRHTNTLPTGKDRYTCKPVTEDEIADSYDDMVEGYIEHFRCNHVL